MNSTAIALPQALQDEAVGLSQLVGRFLDIVRGPDTNREVSTLSNLRNLFENSVGMARSLLVIRVENENSAADCLDRQQETIRQLRLVCGRSNPIAAIGDTEYAVLLVGYDQCCELIPRLDYIVSRAAAGHLNGDGGSLRCRIGVARSPIDSEELGASIAMASIAAQELQASGLAYQFISRRHKSRD